MRRAAQQYIYPPDMHLLSEGWLACRGAAAGVNTTWRGIKRGLAVSNTGGNDRPSLVVDGTNFRSRPVMQGDGVNDVLNNTAITPTLAATGTRPCAIVVGRFRTEPTAAALKAYFGVTDNPASLVSDLLFHQDVAGTPNLLGFHGATNPIAAVTTPTAVEFFADYLTGAVHAISQNGTLTTVADTTAELADVGKVYMFNDRGIAGRFAAASIAAVLYYASLPNMTAVRRWAQQQWGAP